MKKSNWKDVAELIGIAAIVASLIFVGLQMKQSQEIAIAEQYQARASTGVEGMRWLAENDIMRRRYIDAVKGSYESGEDDDVFNEAYETHGPEYLATKYILDSGALVTWDNYYKQYQLGTMDDESWTAFRFRLKRFLRDELSRSIFTDDPQRWRESFRELCTEVIGEIENESAPAE